VLDDPGADGRGIYARPFSAIDASRGHVSRRVHGRHWRNPRLTCAASARKSVQDPLARAGRPLDAP
jgi:hypothetical protein